MSFERVIVSGGSGRLGRFVIEALKDFCAVSVLDIVPPQENVPYVEADVRDYESVRAAFAGQDALVHLAGLDDGKGRKERDYLDINVPGAWNALYAAEDAGLRRVVVASSTAVLGLGRRRMPEYVQVDERHPLRPADAYGLSKQMIETVARGVARRGRLNVVCLRPTWIIPPEQEPETLKLLEKSRDAPGSQRGSDHPECSPSQPEVPPTGSYVRARDAARCIRQALEYESAPFDIFNVSAVDSIGPLETLERLKSLYGRLPEVRNPQAFRDNPYASILGIERARALLHWEPDGDWSDVRSLHGGSA